MILCLETATSVCSAALCSSDGVVSFRESRENKSHATQLTLFIEELLDNAGLGAGELDAVAVSKGPGSYTGLRIGASVAKGIAYAASIPLIGINTTTSMFYGIKINSEKKYGIDKNSLFCPMIDARRMEVYYTIFDAAGKIIKDTSAEIINEKSFSSFPESVRILFFGDGSEKCRYIINHKNSVFAEDFQVSAIYMQQPAYEAFDNKHFENIAYFEPFYLKDFIATIPKNNIIGN
jgi:tRNA threonylcarbamoyladenosine biosynthesis protein TsaB